MEHPRYPDYLRVKVEIGVSLVLDVHFKPSYGQIMPFCDLLQSKSGVEKLFNTPLQRHMPYSWRQNLAFHQAEKSDCNNVKQFPSVCHIYPRGVNFDWSLITSNLRI